MIEFEFLVGFKCFAYLCMMFNMLICSWIFYSGRELSRWHMQGTWHLLPESDGKADGSASGSAASLHTQSIWTSKALQSSGSHRYLDHTPKSSVDLSAADVQSEPHLPGKNDFTMARLDIVFFFQGSKLSVVYRCPSLLESWRFPKMKVNHGKPPNHAKLDHLWPFQYWILLVMNQRIHVILFHSISGCADVSHVDVFILQHPFSVTVFANNDWCGELHE